MSLLEKFRDINLSIIINHDRMKLNSIQITSYLQRQINEVQLMNSFKRKRG